MKHYLVYTYNKAGTEVTSVIVSGAKRKAEATYEALKKTKGARTSHLGVFKTEEEAVARIQSSIDIEHVRFVASHRVVLAAPAPEPINVREKAAAIEHWLGWHHENIAYGLRSVADAEKLYDYWKARPDVLPEMCDEENDEDAPPELCRRHRIAALGYDPLK